MSRQTKIYELVQPEPNEKYDIAVQNGNMDKIEAGLIGRCRTSLGVPTENGKNGDRCYDVVTKTDYVHYLNKWVAIPVQKPIGIGTQLPEKGEEGDLFFVYEE